MAYQSMRVVLLLVAVLVLAVPAGASAAVPLPADDPFYVVPPIKKLKPLRNGQVIKQRSVEATALSRPLPVIAWQLQFKSLDAHNRPTAMITTVMVPTVPWTGAGPRPVVSYQVAEDSADQKCAVSYALRGGLDAALNTQSNASSETNLIGQAIDQGWVVVASDYQGPHSAFFAQPEEAHGVLDGIRAARSFKPAGLARKAPIGLWGYSGGGYATSVAALAKRGYARKLNIVGAAIGAPTASVKAEVRAFSGTIGGGAIAMAIAALDRAYPEQDLPQYLNEAGRRAVAAAAHDCLIEAAERFPLARIEDWEAYPGAIDHPVLTKFLASISPQFDRRHPRMPVFLYHDRNDEFAPFEPAFDMVSRWCRRGTTVAVHVEPVSEHIAYQSIGAAKAIEYLTGRFAGTPPPRTCRP